MTVCGLLARGQEPVLLKSISVEVRGFVADEVSQLRYQNEEKTPVEATFVFPLDAEAAVYAFEGLIGGTRIEAQIREKKQAEQEYEDALSEGHEAFLLERDRNASDIFTCSLGNLPPGGEATLKLSYVQALSPEPDGALRFVLPAVLNPCYVPRGSEGDTVTQTIPRAPKEQLPYTLGLSATLESPYGINRMASSCTLGPLQYTKEDRTAAKVSLAEGHQFDRDVELLIHYEDVHKPNALLEAGKPGAAPGQNTTGEFLFLLDRSGSMSGNVEYSCDSPQRIDNAKETLLFLLKSLPLGCYFNIYGFGSTYDSFYPQSVVYTQQTMSESVQCVKELQADLGETEILEPLKGVYSQPCQEGYPRQLFVFTDGEVHNTDQVIAEVRRHSSSHKCFSFGIGQSASTALVKGIAKAAGGSAEFITGKEHVQAKALQSLKKALQSLKKALQPAVTGISLSWDLPSGLEAVPVGSGPRVIFQGQRCLIYAQIRGQHQLPVHRLAAQALLQELEGAGEKEEAKQRLALETSLSSGVVCSQTAYVGVNPEQGKPLQGPPIHRPILLALCYAARPIRMKKKACLYEVEVECMLMSDSSTFGGESPPGSPQLRETENDGGPTTVKHESPLLTLMSLQNADGSWPLDSGLASTLNLSESEISSKTPAQVIPNAWATMLAIIWLHSSAMEQRDEWELLEAKALSWLRANTGPQLAECVKAANDLLGASVTPQGFGL